MPLFYHMERLQPPHKVRMSLFESSIYIYRDASRFLAAILYAMNNGLYVGTIQIFIDQQKENLALFLASMD